MVSAFTAKNATEKTLRYRVVYGKCVNGDVKIGFQLSYYVRTDSKNTPVYICAEQGGIYLRLPRWGYVENIWDHVAGAVVIRVRGDKTRALPCGLARDGVGRWKGRSREEGRRGGGRAGEGGGTHIVHGRDRETIDPRTPYKAGTERQGGGGGEILVTVWHASAI